MPGAIDAAAAAAFEIIDSAPYALRRYAFAICERREAKAPEEGYAQYEYDTMLRRVMNIQSRHGWHRCHAMPPYFAMPLFCRSC